MDLSLSTLSIVAPLHRFRPCLLPSLPFSIHTTYHDMIKNKTAIVIIGAHRCRWVKRFIINDNIKRIMISALGPLSWDSHSFPYTILPWFSQFYWTNISLLMWGLWGTKAVSWYNLFMFNWRVPGLTLLADLLYGAKLAVNKNMK